MRLFVCLILLKTIAATDPSYLKYESTAKYTDYDDNKFEAVHQRQREYSAEIIKDLYDSGGNMAKYASRFGRITVDKRAENGTTSTEISVTKANVGEKNKTLTENKKQGANKEGMNAESSQMVISYPPYAKYEVTENTLDIPDDRSPAGPIVTNYTIRPPPLPLLNVGNLSNNTNTNKVTEANIKNKKNRITILHINAEYDDKINEIHDNKVFGIIKGIKKYIHGFHRGIVNGIHSFFHKHDDFHHETRFKRATVKEVNHVESNSFLNVDKIDSYKNSRHTVF